jgi:NodT family efflux transporter outer membrane factor (OMF) lipoprotein
MIACTVLGACMVGPNYTRPSVDLPGAYKEDAGWRPAQPRDGEPRGSWWTIYGDRELDALIEQIETSNQNLRLAEAQYREARAIVREVRASFFPSVSGSVSVTRSRAPGSGIEATTHLLSVDAAWEPDLWGRIGRTVEASEASAQASAADLAAARLSAQAELASDYFQLRVLDVERQLLAGTAAAYQKSLELTQNRYAVGVAGKLDVALALAQLKSTQAQELDLGVQRAALEHAIAVLVGKAPAEFAIEPASMGVEMPALPVGVPAQLLERRPDVAAAERRVAAANAQIGVAESAFYPALTIPASAGFQSASLAGWLSAPNQFWAVGPALAQTLFDAGLRRALSDQAIAAYDANVAAYRQTVLAALQSVEDNLAALRILEQEARVQEEAVQAGRESLRLTTNQYKAGTVDYLGVVVVQAAQLSNERSAVTIYGQRLLASVSLIKALGGGWQGLSTQPPSAGNGGS